MITPAESLLAVMWPLVRQNLQTHGKVLPVVFVQTPKGLCPPFSFDAALLATVAGRECIEATIRCRVEEQKATLVMVVAEAWAAVIPAIESAILESGGVIPRARDHKNRREVIQVNIQTPAGCWSGLADVVRDADGKPDVAVEPPEMHPAQSSMRFF